MYKILLKPVLELSSEDFTWGRDLRIIRLRVYRNGSLIINIIMEVIRVTGEIIKSQMHWMSLCICSLRVVRLGWRWVGEVAIGKDKYFLDRIQVD